MINQKKSFFVLLFLLFLSIILSVNTSHAYIPSEHQIPLSSQNQVQGPLPQQLNDRYLGRAINIFEAKYGSSTSIKMTTSILDTNWLNNLNYTITTLSNTYHSSSSGYSNREYLESFNNSINVGVALDASYSYYQGSAQSTFSNTWTSAKNTNINSFFYTENIIAERYRVYVDNAYGLLSNSELDSNFRNHLFILHTQVPQNELNNYVRYLIGLYGTHVVFDAIYGGELTASITSTSSKLDYSYMLSSSAEVEADLSLNLEPKSAGNVSANVNMREKFNQISSNFSKTYFFNASFIGGNNHSITIEENLKPSYSSWLPSLENNVSMIKYNSLIPIWELIPNSLYFENYGTFDSRYIRSLFQNVFNIMKNEQENSINSIKSYKSVASMQYNDIKTVKTTSNWGSTPYFQIELPYSKNELLSNGYSNIMFRVNFTAKEINDGYQHLLLSTRMTESSIFARCLNYELRPGSIQKTFSDSFYNFNAVSISSLDYTSLENEPMSIYLNLNASGNGGNDWEITKVYLEYYLS